MAVRISNNSDRNLTFGHDLKLVYANGDELNIISNEQAFNTLKQKTATYLLYLLLTPVNFYTYKTNEYGGQEETSSVPIGLGLGPGLTAGNMIVASSANKKFKNELLTYDIQGRVIKQGETVYGLIAVRSNNNYDALTHELK